MNVRRSFALAVTALLALSLVGAACGSDGDSEGADSSTTTTTASESAKYLAEADERAKPEMTTAEVPAELIITDDVVGTGAEVEPGDSVTAHYVGVAASTGEEFDSSWERGEPSTFPLDGVIQGWTEGLVGMKEGGRRTLVIPAEMAYGDQGPAPGDALVFTIDLVEVIPGA